MRIKRLKPEDRSFLRKVSSRLSKGWTWQEIADYLGEPLSTVYSRYERLQLRMLQQKQETEAAA